MPESMTGWKMPELFQDLGWEAIWSGCSECSGLLAMPKPSIPKGPWTTKRLAQGRRQEKYMENWQLPFFIKNCSIMLHCSSLLSSPSVPVVEEKQGEGKGQEPSAAHQCATEKTSTRPDLSINLSIYRTLSSSVSSYLSILFLSHPILSYPSVASPHLAFKSILSIHYGLCIAPGVRTSTPSRMYAIYQYLVTRKTYYALLLTKRNLKAYNLKQKNIKMYHICTISIYITYRTVRFDVDLLEQVWGLRSSHLKMLLMSAFNDSTSHNLRHNLKFHYVFLHLPMSATMKPVSGRLWSPWGFIRALA